MIRSALSEETSKSKAPFGSISNMLNPYSVGIYAYCRIDPQAPCGTLSVQSADVNRSVDCFVIIIAKEKEIETMANKEFDVVVSNAEWKRSQKLAEDAFARLRKLGLITSDEFEFDSYDEYEAQEEVNKYVSSRLDWID